MAEKDGAWIGDAKGIAGVDINQNQHYLKCDTNGVLDVNAAITSIFGPIDVIVDNIVPVTQSGVWTVAVNNFPVSQTVNGTVTVLQGTSPWVVTGTITTSPNVNIHDSAGNSLASTGTSLNVDVTNTVPVTLASTTVTGNVTVVQPTGTNLHTIVDNFPAVQPITRVGATLNTNQISIGSTSTLIIAANTNRKRLVLINMGTTNVFIGNIGVTIGTGQLLLGIAGYVIPLYFTGAVYGIVGTGTQTIAYLEEAV